MINAYVVRDPSGRVIGISAVSYRNALDDAYTNEASMDLPYSQLESRFAKDGRSVFQGYTLKRERVQF